jgi:hypothetical protein
MRSKLRLQMDDLGLVPIDSTSAAKLQHSYVEFDDTERGVNQYQVQFKNFFNLYFNQIIYSIISNEK